MHSPPRWRGMCNKAERGLLMKTNKKVLDVLYAVVMFICKIALIADILITSYAVAGRYVGKYIPFLKDPAWSEEVVLTLMTYMAFLAAALAVRKGTHIRMTSLDDHLPKKVCQVLDIFADVLIFIFSMIMIIEGFTTASAVGGRVKYATLPFLSKFWMYAAIPFAGIVIALFILEKLLIHVAALMGKEVE